MSASSAPRRRMPQDSSRRAAGPADLLVVGDRRAGRLVVDDEGEVGLVEAHAERRGGDDDLELVVRGAPARWRAGPRSRCRPL